LTADRQIAGLDEGAEQPSERRSRNGELLGEVGGRGGPGANDSAPGLVMGANGGILFLDDVGELPATV
jgi:sigma54-dependent transcription regulator